MKVYTVEISSKNELFTLVRIFSSKEKAVKYIENRGGIERTCGLVWEAANACTYLVDCYEVE